ncbi:Protein of unknown function DUF541 [Penicillium bovifimosum]|uniref:SIMPL domain-containing protein n=1 Tax=Penicillium bovifimosum TaxID=126998 RepID=A0A9W9GWQ9_9EURO|nr:Protein of unknown function DUF541 [Penicillium bovifimosum]KAJ5131288.1 Protein of unknown function DUF541 [Penicillium bovifimosum]
MAPLKIVVYGKSSVSHAPERGILRFSVKSNGEEQETVAKEVTTASTDLQRWFKSSYFSTDSTIDAPETKFSSTSMRTWKKSIDKHDAVLRDMPLPNPFNASISFKAVFHDFSKLNHAIEQLLAYPNVEIDSLKWGLTDETGDRLASDARKLALRDAIQQAKDYSEVLGRDVAVVEISDQGSSPYGTARFLSATSHGNHRSEHASLDLTPQDIEVEGNVQVTFQDA